jgi:NitT/TauT family transport system substrate-binding protein
MIRDRFTALAVFTTLLLSPAMSLANDHVNVSVYQSVSDAGIYIANDRGYFKDENIDVELVQLDAVSSVVTALASGQVDVAGGAPSAAIYNASRQGIGIKIVADKGSMQHGNGYLGVVIRKSLAGDIKTFSDLRGRKVAWTGHGAGTTNEVALDKILRKTGLKEDDLSLENLTFGDSLSALATGSVDAAYLIEPLMQGAEEKNIGRILLTGDEIYPNQQVAVLLYGPDFVQHKPDVAQRFMKAYLRGVRDYDNAFRKNIDKAGIIEILSRNTNVRKPELYEKMVMPGLDPDGTVNVAGMTYDMNWFLSKGFLKQPVDVSGVVDMTFANKAVQQLGAYK